MTIVNIGPQTLDLLGIRAGDRNAVRVKVTSGGVPLNLTGYTVTAQARPSPLGPVALTGTVEDIDATAGTFTLRWPGDDVRTLLDTASTWEGVWDIQIASGALDATTLAAGKFRAQQDVTR